MTESRGVWPNGWIVLAIVALACSNATSARGAPPACATNQDCNCTPEQEAGAGCDADGAGSAGRRIGGSTQGRSDWASAPWPARPLTRASAKARIEITLIAFPRDRCPRFLAAFSGKHAGRRGSKTGRHPGCAQRDPGSSWRLPSVIPDARQRDPGSSWRLSAERSRIAAARLPG